MVPSLHTLHRDKYQLKFKIRYKEEAISIPEKSKRRRVSKPRQGTALSDLHAKGEAV